MSSSLQRRVQALQRGDHQQVKAPGRKGGGGGEGDGGGDGSFERCFSDGLDLSEFGVSSRPTNPQPSASSRLLQEKQVLLNEQRREEEAETKMEQMVQQIIATKRDQHLHQLAQNERGKVGKSGGGSKSRNNNNITADQLLMAPSPNDATRGQNGRELWDMVRSSSSSVAAPSGGLLSSTLVSIHGSDTYTASRHNKSPAKRKRIPALSLSLTKHNRQVSSKTKPLRRGVSAAKRSKRSKHKIK